jgi:hypothetical protein
MPCSAQQDNYALLRKFDITSAMAPLRLFIAIIEHMVGRGSEAKMAAPSGGLQAPIDTACAIICVDAKGGCRHYRFY